ncbi:isoleucine--tRNA ligase [Candidatus Saccharibacteria bacterium]|nr:isoleucine--tRNA ligase [Candidatus Saccharibacteria bacterium]
MSVSKDNQKSPFAEYEEEILKTWAKEKTFEKSLQNRKGGKTFTFYDGPPFANGTPHVGHLGITTIKDTVTRYKTMQGYYVPRRVGWDTHGLPVEYAIEKEHDFKGKKDILEYGIDKFNQECRDSVFKYKDVWEKMFHRVGRWADYDNTYATLDEGYIESVWWVFKSLYDKQLVYKAFRSSPYCPRCATPLSNFELNQGYQDNIEDPSLFVKFKLTDEDAYLLAWTTTPWSLPGNAAIAVKPDAKYVYVTLKDDDGKSENLILARDRLEILNSEDYHISREVHGQDLVGKTYEPLFRLKQYEHGTQKYMYKVWPADFVSIEDGSGVLHVAPAFGEDDLSLGAEKVLDVLHTVDENGHIVTDQNLPEEFAGKFFKSADRPIIEHLTKQGLVYAAETIRHTYPFCWRCDTPLLYYATDSWLVKVTGVKDQLVANNKQINWTPAHIKEGRFGKWLENARDWAISRNRFWGAPLPIWVTDDGEVVVIGSVQELKERAVDPSKVGDLHRPFIDDIEIKTDSGKIAKRIPEVFDCWFESGSMPYAQDHYPFKDKDQWEQQFPADFIAEATDQTRGWFYTLHVLATALFDKPAFQNVICSGWIMAADGEKLSKRKKNYAPMDDVFDQYGVDSLRFFMASSPLMNGEDTRFSVDFLRDVQRKIFMTYNNMFNFYKLYADVDKWTPKNPLVEPKSDNLLDQWMIARLNEVIQQVTGAMESYRLDKATRPIGELLDDASNWYVRRSRRRFWKSEDDSDKQMAYETLHYTLLRISQLLAPFSPFLADRNWRALVQGTDLPESVHLSDWPSVNKPDTASRKILEEMKHVQDIVREGLRQRAEHRIKVRQPLPGLTYTHVPKKQLSSGFENIIKEEVNVKAINHNTGFWKDSREVVSNLQVDDTSVTLDTEITDELRAEGIARDLVRFIQAARKNADFKVDDRIKLLVESDSTEITEAMKQFKEDIYTETLTTGELTGEVEYTETVKVDAQQVTIKVSRNPGK